MPWDVPARPGVTQSFLPCGGGRGRGSLHRPGAAELLWPRSRVVPSPARGPVRGFPAPPHPAAAGSRRDAALPCAPLPRGWIKPSHTILWFCPTHPSPLFGTSGQSWTPLAALTHPLPPLAKSSRSSHPTAQPRAASVAASDGKLVFPGCCGKGNRFISLVP